MRNYKNLQNFLETNAYDYSLDNARIVVRSTINLYSGREAKKKELDTLKQEIDDLLAADYSDEEIIQFSKEYIGQGNLSADKVKNFLTDIRDLIDKTMIRS